MSSPLKPALYLAMVAVLFFAFTSADDLIKRENTKRQDSSQSDELNDEVNKAQNDQLPERGIELNDEVSGQPQNDAPEQETIQRRSRAN
jgi:hypothetical protein